MFGDKLRNLRAEKKITQQKLADDLDMTKGAVAMWETGKRMPDSGTLLALARYFDVSVDFLLEAERDVPFGSRVRTKRLPLLGNVACGEPCFADGTLEAYLPADETLDADFCLRASGDSMINARIFDGDILYVKSQDMVNDGEIAVVLIEDEATVKRFYYDREGNIITLVPENPTYRPMRFEGARLEQVRVLGKVVSGQYAVK